LPLLHRLWTIRFEYRKSKATFHVAPAPPSTPPVSPRATGSPPSAAGALDAAGRPQARATGHGRDGGLVTGRRRGWESGRAARERRVQTRALARQPLRSALSLPSRVHPSLTVPPPLLAAGRTASRPARGWGCVRWPPQPRGCLPDGTVAK
jgi:hypothetical protein